MNAKALSVFLASGLLIMAAWFAHRPNPALSQLNEDGSAREVPLKYRETVHKGLEYLVKHQFKDGHWEGDGGRHPVAMTALAGMALLMEPSNVLSGKYAANIRKSADWLMAQSQREGLIFSGHASESDRYMEGHGLATQVLAWASRGEPDEARRKKLADVFRRAVQYIVSAQSTQGGWHHTSKVEGHDFSSVSPTAIQVQALDMARDMGIAVDVAIADGQEYLKSALENEPGAKPAPTRNKAAETAAALACRFNPSRFRDRDGLAKWFKDCRAAVPMGRDIEFGRDEFTHYYYAQAIFNAMLNSNNETAVAWSDYRAALFDHLKSSQANDGSWPAPLKSQMGISVGPVYATAVWCTILQLDTRRHPLTREPRNIF
jgi:hypothetical protein